LAEAPLHLVVDARWVKARPTGVGESILRQLAGLDRLLAKDPTAARVSVIRWSGGLDSPAARARWQAFSHLRFIDVSASPSRHPMAEIWQQVRLPRLLKSIRADVLYSPAYVGLFRRGIIPQVAMFHDDLIWSQPDSYRWRFRLYLATAMRLTARASQRIIFPSDDARERVASRLGLAKEYTAVLRHGIGESEPTPQAAKEPIALYVASAEERKNHDVLLRSIPLLNGRVEFVFVGFCPDERRLMQLRRQHPTGWRTIEQLDSAELAALQRRASLVVHPAKGEGFGLPVLEAQAAETPVVAADTPVLREVSGGHARFCSPNAPEEWAAAIKATLDETEETARIVSLALSNSRLYGLERNAIGLLTICGEALRDFNQTGA
jgi:glycosyltransferase involved in cell wall biosynthesis